MNIIDITWRLLKEEVTGEPPFSKAEADIYYPKEYMDRDRNHVFQKLAEWQVYMMLRTQHTPLYVQFPLTRNLNRRSNQEEMDLHQGLTEYRTSSTRGVQS